MKPKNEKRKNERKQSISFNLHGNSSAKKKNSNRGGGGGGGAPPFQFLYRVIQLETKHPEIFHIGKSQTVLGRHSCLSAFRCRGVSSLGQEDSSIQSHGGVVEEQGGLSIALGTWTKTHTHIGMQAVAPVMLGGFSARCLREVSAGIPRAKRD